MPKNNISNDIKHEIPMFRIEAVTDKRKDAFIGKIDNNARIRVLYGFHSKSMPDGWFTIDVVNSSNGIEIYGKEFSGEKKLITTIKSKI